MSSLENRVVVVTGSSQGIGRAIALGLAHKKAVLALVARNGSALQDVAEMARTSSPCVVVYAADLVVDGAGMEIAKSLSQQFGGLDILIHCAGAYSRGALETASVDEFDRLYRTNVRAPYGLTQSLLPLLKKRKGQIAFINSTQGAQARACVGQFAATQHALKAIADSLREEVNADGVRVVSLYCGRTATPRMEAIYKLEGREYKPELLLQPEDIAEVLINTLMVPRTAEVTNLHMRPLIKSY